MVHRYFRQTPCCLTTLFLLDSPAKGTLLSDDFSSFILTEEISSFPSKISTCRHGVPFPRLLCSQQSSHCVVCCSVMEEEEVDDTPVSITQSYRTSSEELCDESQLYFTATFEHMLNSTFLPNVLACVVGRKKSCSCLFLLPFFFLKSVRKCF